MQHSRQKGLLSAGQFVELSKKSQAQKHPGTAFAQTGQICYWVLSKACGMGKSVPC